MFDASSSETKIHRRECRIHIKAVVRRIAPQKDSEIDAGREQIAAALAPIKAGNHGMLGSAYSNAATGVNFEVVYEEKGRARRCSYRGDQIMQPH